MVEVDPTSAVVGAAGGAPLIDTFQEPVAAVCVGARRRVGLRHVAQSRRRRFLERLPTPGLSL